MPEARLDLVRVGIAAYGIDPAPGIAALAGVALRPVMRLCAPSLVNVKQIPAGAGLVRMDLDRRAPTTVGLVPLGYGDGIRARQQPGLGGLVGWPGTGPRPDLHGPVRRRAGRGTVAEPGEESSCSAR